MSAKPFIDAVGYCRTSSATNVGAGKDSETRQKLAIEAFAKQGGYRIVGWYYDAEVKGADPVDQRPAFRELMQRLLSNGVRTIIVETANRFARDLIVQETGYALLKGQGINLIAADKPDAFLDDTPTATLIRQVLGAVSEFEKAMLVSKLRGARNRKRAATGHCEGRKGYDQTNPDLVSLAKKLHRYPVNGKRRSLRDVAQDLETKGYLTASGKPFSATQVKRLIDPA